MESQADDELRLSNFLSERYEKLFKIGEGGMGVVYRAYDKILLINVAIKVMRPTGSLELVHRFQQEARAAAKLKHANAIRELDCGVLPDNSLYIVMEYVDGISLEKLVAARGRLSCRQALPIFLQIVAGMEHAHGIGLLHRDLKPSNIILVETPGASSVAKIVDFGLAVMVENKSETESSGVMGSPLYMAPEAFESQLVDERSDIYSLGCLMMQSLTLSPPFVGKTTMDTIMEHRTKTPPKLSDRLPHDSFPPQLEEIIDKCLGKKPDSRYQSMRELYGALATVQAVLAEADLNSKDSKPIRETEIKKPRTVKKIVYFAVAVVAIGVAAMLVQFGLSSAMHFSPDQKIKSSVDPVVEKKEEDVLMTTILDDNFGERISFGMKWVYNQPPVEDKDLKELSKRSDIERLWLHESELKGSGLKYVRNNKLISLALIECAIDADGIKEVAKFNTLTVLRLIRTPFLNDQSLTPLTQLQLHTLYVNECSQLTNDSMTTLSKFTTLRKLSLKDMPQYNSSGFSKLATLTNLEALTLTGTGVNAAGLRSLKKFKHLYALDVTGLPVNDDNIDDIALHSLQALSLRKTNVTLTGLKKLKQCSKLRLLDIRECPNVGREAVFVFQNVMPKVALVSQYGHSFAPEYDDDLLMYIPPAANR